MDARGCFPSWPSVVVTLRHYLVARKDAIVAAGHGPDLARVWPEGVATLAQSDAHTDAELERIEAAIRTVEQIHKMPFIDGDPRAKATPEPFPIAPTLEEGGDSPPVVVEVLRARYLALSTAQRATVDACTRLADGAGWPLNLNAQPTRRRAAIADALISAADLAIADIFVLIAEVTGAPEHADAGTVIGTMPLEQAHRLADAVAAFRDNHQATKAS